MKPLGRLLGGVVGRVVRRCALAVGLGLAVVPLAAQPVPSSSSAEALSLARSAAERRDFPAALAAYARVLKARPDDADVLIEVARVQGYADRNAEAAAMYRQALAAAPGRRADIVPSLAWQTLWAGDARQAAALFAEWSGVSPGLAEPLDGWAQALQAQDDQAGALALFRRAQALAPQDVRLKRRLALSLLWNGHEDEAVTALSALQALQPADRELAWSLANARNFAGLHRTALADFGRWPAPTHPGERADLARAWRWAGYEDKAWPLLADPTDAESAWLRDWRVRRELAPFGYSTVERADDRDRLVSRAWVVGAGWHPRAGSTLEFQVRRLGLQDAAGDPSGTQFQASWRWRLGDADSRNGTWWPTLSLRIQRVGGWSSVAPAARLRWVPADRWRFDAEATRELVEAPRALAERVHVDVISVGGEHQPDTRWTVAGSTALLRFDDGSTRLRLAGRTERRVLARPRVSLGVEASAFERVRGDAGIDRGYWNPRRYAESRAYVALAHDWRPFDVQARLGLGVSREVDASGAASSGRPHLWELGLGWDAARDLRLRLAMGGSGQGLGLNGGGAGYWRRYVNLSLNGWF